MKKILKSTLFWNFISYIFFITVLCISMLGILFYFLGFGNDDNGLKLWEILPIIGFVHLTILITIKFFLYKHYKKIYKDTKLLD